MVRGVKEDGSSSFYDVYECHGADVLNGALAYLISVHHVEGG